MKLWNKVDNFPPWSWPTEMILTILPCGYDQFWQLYPVAMTSEASLAIFVPYMWDFFSWKNHLRFFDNFPPLLLAKVDNCTPWPWYYEFTRKKFDNCTLRIFDNFTPWILDNFPLCVIWQFSVSVVLLCYVILDLIWRH